MTRQGSFASSGSNRAYGGRRGPRIRESAPERILIRGARLVDRPREFDRVADLYVAEGEVVGIGSAPGAARFEADRTIDGQGLLLTPGLFDLAARLREPGNAYRANLGSELSAAVAGGVTDIVCLPDTEPALDEPGLIEMLVDRAHQQSLSHLHPLGALTVGLAGQKLTEMVELRDAGCIGFSQANEPIVDTEVLIRAMQYARTFDFTVFLQPRDPYLSRGGVAHSGAVATRLGLPGIPALAETVAVNTIIELVRSTGCRVHLCRLSTAQGLERLRQARAEGLPITADVAEAGEQSRRTDAVSKEIMSGSAKLDEVARTLEASLSRFRDLVDRLSRRRAAGR